jgi:transketolase
LGQGLSVACGAALTKKFNKDSSIVYVLTGDGELEEGQNWEALMFAAHHKLDNMIITVDYNGQQIDGPTKKVMNLGNLKAKFESFGLQVLEMNGNVMEEVVDTLTKAKTLTGQQVPIAILMKTTMGYGVDFMMTGHEWHGIAPNDAQLAKALEQLPQTIGDY